MNGNSQTERTALLIERFIWVVVFLLAIVGLYLLVPWVFNSQPAS